MQTATKVSRRNAAAPSGKKAVILSFSGDIASTSKSAIMEAYHGVSPDVTDVLLDFSGVDYINSSGIAIIIQMLLESHADGQRKIGIFGLTPHFAKVFNMVGVAKYAAISPNEERALASI